MFEDLLDALTDSHLEEKPVDIKTFVEGKDYLGMPKMSDIQYKVIEAGTQVYTLPALIELYGEDQAKRIWRNTVTELILQLGKGSGKGLTSTIIVARVVYLLLCLKDPSRFFGKPSGDNIDIINIAINATQAKEAFFKNVVKRVKNSPWFAGKFDDKAASIHFDKNINVYSGHSERESWEGYNVIMVILDEISGFNMESASNNEGAKTSDAIYKMYRASVDSRFAGIGKVICLSFPRYKGDFISKRYDEVVAEKNVETIEHIFRHDEEIPFGNPDNEFMVSYDVDHIISYKVPKVFALKRPSWMVNPLISLDKLALSFLGDPIDALSRFACMPPEAVDAFFKSREKIEHAFRTARLAIDEDGRFEEDFKPDSDKEYFIHVDLAEKHDRAAVSMAHVSNWQVMSDNKFFSDPVPNVVVDLVRWWTPSSDKNVDFGEIRDFIKSLRQRGFRIELVTFDRWQSTDSMRELSNYGMNVELLSVAKKHYDDFQLLVQEERLLGPGLAILRDELLALKLTNRGKVDHTRHGKKDLSDAVAGAIFNAVSRSRRDVNTTVEVYDMDELRKRHNSTSKNLPNGTIVAPKSSGPMPDELKHFLESMKVI